MRRRAENRLHQQPAGRRRVDAKADAQRMLHELQVHQIELELQNEELKQSKASIEAGLEKYTDLYDFAPVGYFSLDEQGTILDLNLTGAALLGSERSNLCKRRFQFFVEPRHRPAFNAFLERIFTGHRKLVCEVSLQKSDQSVLWADVQAMSAITVSGERKWCRVAVIDISARKNAEDAQHRIDILASTNRHLKDEIVRREAVEKALKESEQRTHQLLEQSQLLQKKLRRMSHSMISIQEDQRREISRELHDKISQLLIGISVHLGYFTKAAEKNPKGIRQTIDPIRRLVRKSVRVVHQFARELRPAMLDDLGLIPALRSHIHEMPLRKGRIIKFAANDDIEALDNDKKTALYRVTQEALVNISKHARASEVKISIIKIKGVACLDISDNGKSFDVNRLLSPEWGDRLGVNGMRERIEMLGGRFNIVSKPGTGTTIRAEIPFGKSKMSI